MRIFTHMAVDLDAAASVWAARKFIPGASAARVDFRPANWDGAEMEEGDIAVDMDVCGNGMKGKQDANGVVHSCFMLIIDRYAPDEDKAALRDLIRFVDIQDAHGSVTDTLLSGVHNATRAMFARVSIGSVLRALQVEHERDDTIVVKRMSEIFSGMLEMGRARARAVQEAEESEILPGGEVAIVRHAKEHATTGILFRCHGVRAIVYVDGNSVGVIRDNKETVRVDHPDIRAVVAAAGEEYEGFAHSAGFLFCRGSRKAPAQTASRVDPRLLANAVAEVFAKHTRD